MAGDLDLTPPNMEETLGSRPGMTGQGSTLKASGARTKNTSEPTGQQGRNKG